MMSTADKETVSDFVMRRRFGFFELTPEFDSDGFHEYEQRLDSDTFVLLIDRIKLLNHEISKDPKLGKGFCIGHGYFCGQAHQTEEGMSEIVEYEILPLLQEYWPDNPEKVRHWGSVLRSLFMNNRNCMRYGSVFLCLLVVTFLLFSFPYKQMTR